MKTYILVMIIFIAVICVGFSKTEKLQVGKYNGYTLGYEVEKIDNKYVKKRTKAPSTLTINSDNSFELIFPDVSRGFRPNKTKDFYSKGKYEVHGDTLVLNSQYQYSDYIYVFESKRDFCNNNVLGIELKYSDYYYDPTYIIDGKEIKLKRKVDTTIQRFQKITIELVDTFFENDEHRYSVSDSKPSFFRNTQPRQIKLSRFHPSIRNWTYLVKDTSSNYFQCFLTSDINEQNLVLENERFLIVDSFLIHLNQSFLEIDTFKISK